MFHKILFHYSCREDDLRRGNGPYTDVEKSKVLAARWIEALRFFVQIVSITELDKTIDECKYKCYKNANNALEFALAVGVQNEEVLSLLKNPRKGNASN